jgi:hypothetical protein
MDLQNKILDYCEELLRSTRLDDETICSTLRFFHSLFPLAVAYAILFGSKKIFYILMVANIIIYSLFIYFNGCILTRLEKRFCDDDFIVADPFLEFLGIPVNHDTRFKFTIYWFILNFFLAISVYYYRFIYKWKTEDFQEVKTI